VTFTGATQISFVTPSHAAGAEDIVVANRDGDTATLTDGFTFLGAGGAAPPTPRAVTTISPSQGVPAGGTVVTITGTGFATGASVTFGGSAATAVTVTSSTSLTATTPDHAAGTVDVVVTVGSQSVTKTGGFTYTATPTTTPGSTTTTTPGSTTTTTPGATTTTTPNPTTTGTPTSLTPTAIENANKRIEFTVTRDGDVNVIKWTLPSSRPATVMGVQIWRSNSPYTLVQDIPASDPDFADGEFRDTSSAAKETSKYLVTMYYGLTSALGQFTNANAPDTTDYPGVASVDSAGADDDSSDGSLPTWAIVLIALGILFLVVLIAVLIARGRNRDGQQTAAAQGYAWQEEGEAKAAEGEWQPPAEVHQARCPACATSFTATGQKPIVTVCPGCGKKGILR
jgi:hypothetical protein